MVTILSANTSIKESFYYNENKVKQQVASCLMAANYPRDLSSLNEMERLNMLRKMAALNTRTKVNCLHITLNFAPSERFSSDKLKAITMEYMQQLGFDNQPYLVYQHFDSAHPHLHIVTTNIQADSSRIDLHHLGIRKSEPARKAIEKQFKLVRAEDQLPEKYELNAVNMDKVSYGLHPTKRAIANVLKGVINTYKYGSLHELNAVLGLYHVRAERGSLDSRIYKKNGLIYRVTDQNDAVVGVPVKASLFSGKPILKYLESRFKINEIERHKHKSHLKNAIELALNSTSVVTFNNFITSLQKAGVDAVFRRSTDGLVFGITYIDHNTRCVFNGSTLGKKYSIKAVQDKFQKIQNKFSFADKNRPVTALAYRKSKQVSISENTPNRSESPLANHQHLTETDRFLQALFQPEYTWEPDPYALWRRRKKKKRKHNINQ